MTGAVGKAAAHLGDAIDGLREPFTAAELKRRVEAALR